MQPEIRRSVKTKSEYVIRFSELSVDTETFEFRLEESFFQGFESSEWEKGDVTVDLTATKRVDGITLDFVFAGFVEVICDRCLDSFPQEIEADYTLYVKFGDEAGELDDNIVVVPRDENQMDLSTLFYEYLLLSLPIQRIHPDKENGESGCNSEMIKKLERHQVEEEKTDTDPRWDELKKLFD